jgi:two-component system, sensor histidine kinase FlrB
MNTSADTSTVPSQHLAELLSAFEMFTGASSAIERQHAELSRHLQQLRQDLLEANERLSVLIKALPAAVLLVEHGQITHFNDAAAQLIQGLRTNTTWQLPDHWHPGEGPNEFMDGSGPEARTLQLQQKDTDGRTVIQIQDITENLRTVEETERVNRLAAMGKMSAGIAHQLRTPLSTALLYASHLRNPNLDDEDRTDFAQRLQKQLLALENLSSQMLQFIKPALQATHICPLDDLVREAAEQVQGLYQRHQIPLQLSLSATGADLEAEPAQLVAALVAILENAAQASQPGQPVQVCTHREGRRAEIRIEDHGSGIPSDMLANLFEPFATSRASGTGLGLSMASNTIRRHRGEVNACNRDQGGAVFTVVLPVLVNL